MALAVASFVAVAVDLSVYRLVQDWCAVIADLAGLVHFRLMTLNGCFSS